MNSPLKKRGIRFVKTFPAVLRDPRLSVGAKALYGVLKAYSDASGKCFPSLARLAADLNSNRKSVVAWMKELTGLHVVFRAPSYKDGLQTTSVYTMNDEHFVKHLAVKPAGPKNGPLGQSKKRTTEVDPLKKSAEAGNVIPMPKTGTAG